VGMNGRHLGTKCRVCGTEVAGYACACVIILMGLALVSAVALLALDIPACTSQQCM
jgi:hypothetical protein